MRPINLVSTLVLWLLPTVAHAHSVGLSRSDWHAEPPSSVRAHFSFSALEVTDAESARQWVLTGVQVTRGTSCPASYSDGQTRDEGVEVTVLFNCDNPSADDRVQVNFSRLLDSLRPGHRHVSAGQVAFAERPQLELQLVSAKPSALAFIPMGIEHILTGFDHLLFIFALLLGSVGLRTLVGVVSAFTLGHTATLAFTSLSQWSPSPRVVEPLIALSIVYVALENVWAARQARPHTHRWAVALTFGLVHGFGFAGALREITLPTQELLPALLGFNLGVELGQLAVITLPVIILWRLKRQRPELLRVGAPALSALLVVPGSVWLVFRLLEVNV